MRRVVIIACLVAGAGCGSNEPASPRGTPAPAPAPSAPRAPAAPPETPTTADATAVTAEDLSFCVTETNRYRAQAGLPAISEASDVAAYAAQAARADHASGQAHGYTSGAHEPAGAYAENEVVQWPLTSTSRAVIERALAAFWAEGPGGPHYENMRGAWQRLGCGLHLDGDRATLVQHFR